MGLQPAAHPAHLVEQFSVLRGPPLVGQLVHVGEGVELGGVLYRVGRSGWGPDGAGRRRISEGQAAGSGQAGGAAGKGEAAGLGAVAASGRRPQRCAAANAPRLAPTAVPHEQRRRLRSVPPISPPPPTARGYPAQQPHQ
jgi:hypothetical protein